MGKEDIKEGDGHYTVLVDGKVKTYTNWKDIPDSFENIIKFNPTAPPIPHSEEDHKYIESLTADAWRLYATHEINLLILLCSLKCFIAFPSIVKDYCCKLPTIPFTLTA